MNVNTSGPGPLGLLLRYDRYAVSLDAATGDEGATTFGDIIITSSALPLFDIVAQAMLGGQVDEILGHLSEAECRVISLRYGLYRGERHAQGEVGELHDLPAERVRRIERFAITKFRRGLVGGDARDLLAS